MIILNWMGLRIACGNTLANIAAITPDAPMSK
jgi:hypothetical protein